MFLAISLYPKLISPQGETNKDTLTLTNAGGFQHSY